EVKLQQTQVARVVPRYLEWLERWPTVAALAASSTADVLRDWQGLGYNRRALNLQRAAREVAANGWPDDLTRLPGVGPYTAAAVGCFAFERAELPVDVNVRRVRERTGSEFDHTCAQALMDLGATVCLARRLEQRDGDGGETLPATGEPELVGRGRAHVHDPRLDLERLRQTRAHRSAQGRDLRLLGDEHAVRVGELPPLVAHLRVGAHEQ